MTSTGLLPEGFHDRLPPMADAAARLEGRVLGVAGGYGYERVDPPLAEFEGGLAGRLKAASVRDAVRFVDPVSQATLAIRPDMTAQVGRIAATRMGHHPRPLRLSYAGAVLRLRASELNPRRATRQIGAELIGLDTVAAASEIVRVAVEALSAAGVTGASLDFTLPDLVPMLASGRLSDDTLAALLRALDAKDVASVVAIAPDFAFLVEAAGPFDRAIARLRAADGDGRLGSRLDGLAAIAETVGDGIALTLDPTERHGFEYQSWLGFSIFARGIAGEVGRGGSYAVIHADGAEEVAVGFSLFPDALLDAGVDTDQRRRLFLPFGTPDSVAAEWRAAGWAAVAALQADDTPEAQLCSHRLSEGEAIALEPHG